MKRRLAVLFLSCASIAVAGPARAAERNGTWWNSLQAPQRLAYATGFLDGTKYAAFAVSGAIRKTMMDPRTGQRSAARAAQAEEIMYMNIDAIQDEVKDITPENLVDATNRIYADPRNAGIGILEVLYAAMRSVRGASEADTARFLERQRPPAPK